MKIIQSFWTGNKNNNIKKQKEHISVSYTHLRAHET